MCSHRKGLRGLRQARSAAAPSCCRIAGRRQARDLLPACRASLTFVESVFRVNGGQEEQNVYPATRRKPVPRAEVRPGALQVGRAT